MALDWMTQAANKIWDETEGAKVERIRQIIFEHNPLLPDTLYMPVPRCDGCKHWTRIFEGSNILRPTGYCNELVMITKLDFGCVKWEAK